MSAGRRLLLFAPSAYGLGGVATWLDALVPGLRSLGWDARVFLVSGAFHDAVAYRKAHPGLGGEEVACATGTREGRVRALARAVARGRADLVLGVNLPDAYAAVERLRRRGGASAPRIVAALHGLAPDQFEDLREFREVLDGVVCANRLGCRLAVADGGLEERRVHYAPCGVPSEAPPPRRAGPRLEVAFVGRLEEFSKRIGDLARAAELLCGSGAPVRLTVVGDGPDGAPLRERLAPLAARGCVRFLGALTAQRVWDEVYPACDVLLVTSFWEAGPIVVWEAMARGLAVVSSRYLGSGLEGALVDGGNCRLFPVGDASAAAAAVLGLWDPAERGRLARNAGAMVREHYSVAASVGAWHEALSLVARSPAAGVRSAPAPTPAAGRLDRLLGSGRAEDVRVWLGRRPPSPGGPGDEWPHSYGRRLRDDPAFLRLASRLDAAGPRGDGEPG